MKLRAFFISLLIFGSLVTSAQNHITFQSVNDIHDFFSWKPKQYPLISAHRGGPMPGFPENSLEAIQNAILYDRMVTEFDVSLTKDSILVLMHDDRLERTTTGTGLIKDFTFQELQKLSLKDPEGKITQFKIPRFSDVLSWAKGKVLMTVDVKRGVPFEMVVKEIEQAKAEPSAIVITYNVEQAALVHRLNPSLMISVSASKVEDVVRLNSAGVPYDRMVAFVGTSVPDLSFYKYLQSKRIVSILGTMGNLDKSAEANPDKRLYAQYLKDGANILSTKNVILATEQLREYRSEQNLTELTIE